MINHHRDSTKKSQNKMLRLEKYCSYTVFIQIKAGLILTPAWAQINAGVQCSKVNKHLCKMQKGFI